MLGVLTDTLKNPVYYDKHNPRKISTTNLIHPPVTFSDCFANSTFMKKEITELKERILQLEAESSALKPLCSLLNPTVEADTASLISAASLIDALSSEISHRLRCNRQVVIFNVPDKLPAEKAKQIILQLTGLKDKTCRASRLRKLKPSLTCPLMLEFQDEIAPKILLDQRRLLCVHPTLLNARLCAARTPMQPELAQSNVSPKTVRSIPCSKPLLITIPNVGSNVPKARGKGKSCVASAPSHALHELTPVKDSSSANTTSNTPSFAETNNIAYQNNQAALLSYFEIRAQNPCAESQATQSASANDVVPLLDALVVNQENPNTLPNNLELPCL